MAKEDRRVVLKAGGLLALALAAACSPLSSSTTPEGEPTPIPTPGEMEPGGGDVGRVVTAEYGDLSPSLNQAVLDRFGKDHPELEAGGVDKSVIALKARTDTGAALSFALVHVVGPGPDSSALVESNYWVFDRDGDGNTTSYLEKGRSLEFVKLLYAYPQEDAVVIGFGSGDFLDTPLLRYRRIESYPAFSGLSSSQITSAVETMDRAGLEDLAGYVGLTFYPPLLSTAATPAPAREIEVTGYSKVLAKLVPPSQPEFTETTENLEEILNNWLNGKIEVSDENRFTVPGNNILLFGYTDAHSPKVENRTYLYHSFLLGTKVIDGHLIIFGGFEDKDGKRFFLPFNAGLTNSDSAFDLLTIRKTPTLRGSSDDDLKLLSVNETAAFLRDYEGKAVLLATDLDTTGLNPKAVGEDNFREMSLQTSIALQTATFMYNARNSSIHGLDVPPLTNQVPAGIDPSTIPTATFVIVSETN